MPLDVAGLGHHDDLVAAQRPALREVGEHGADQPLAAAVGVVGGGVDQVAARPQRVGQRLAVGIGVVVHAIAAEAHPAAQQAGRAERAVAGLGRGLARGVARGAFGGGAAGQRRGRPGRGEPRSSSGAAAATARLDVGGIDHRALAGEVAADVEGGAAVHRRLARQQGKDVCVAGAPDRGG